MSKIIAIILASILCAIAGQLLLKAGMNRVGRVSRGGQISWRAGLSRVVVGLGLYGISTVLWLFALSRVELSFAFPFISLSYVGIILAAHFALGEDLDRTRLAGSSLIVLGVLLVSLS